MKTAMKAGDKIRVSTLRMLQSRILEREVELRARKGRDYHLDDDETTDVLVSYAKQRRQSIESYVAGGRPELADKEREELAIVEEYLPRQLGAAELEALVDQAVSVTGANSLKDLGAVMKRVMAEAKGGIDGKTVNEIVKRRLLSQK
jgi:uncharacterized protein YqeY